MRASSSGVAGVRPTPQRDFVRWLAFNVANVKAAEARDVSERTRLLKSVSVSGIGGDDEVATVSRQLAAAATQDEFVIGRDGRVASAEEARSEGTLSPDMRACIVNEFRKLEFPILPLIFRPGNQ